MFIEFNNDQRRELVNTRQRFQSLRNALQREFGYRGSMVWDETGGRSYLLRSYYDETGQRRQKSLGPRSAETLALKSKFDTERAEAIASRKALDEVVARQAAVNRALGLGRVPMMAAKIVGLLDKRGLLGNGLRIVGTNALYCYEAACGVAIDSGVTTTEDIDLLFDARRTLRFIGDVDIPSRDLVDLLKLADRSFRQTKQAFRAENNDGYLVDLIKPQTNPPWAQTAAAIGGQSDLQAIEIEGLAWLQNTASFEQVVINEKGQPFRMVSPDPRAFAIHKFWLANRLGRDPLKRERDKQQALVVARLVQSYLPHLPFDASELRMIPLAIVEEALAAFRRVNPVSS